jgi:excisionase family DNA binding protein
VAESREFDESFLTVAEVAEMLKLNQQTVRNWIDQGKLPAVHIGRRVRIRRADFDALLEASVIGGPQPITSSIWDGEIPLPQVPADVGPNSATY